MYKNQLQELAQRSCFNLPSYACIREGPDHAPRFKASVNFNGEIFEAPSYCTTLRQAEHAAAEVALNTLSTRGPSRFLAARVLDEIGVYKNLLQETAHRAGLNLPVYTTERSGPGHLPVFSSIVELAGMNFTGESARTKKQAEKNAAMAAWSTLKQMSNMGSTSQTNKETENNEEQEHVVVARVLSNFRPKGENRTWKQRDQNQVRKRMVSCYKEKNSGSSSKTFLNHQQWRSMGFSSDFSSIYSTQRQNQQKNSFSTLVPSIASKILPTTSSTDMGIQVQVRSNSQIRIQDIPPPLDEHQKDEDEWLYGREKSIEKDSNSNSVSRPKPTYHKPLLFNSPMFDHTQPIHIRTMPYKAPLPNGGIAPTSTIPSPRILNNTGFYAHSVAPAVHIRSVIPVCATPPMRPPSSNSQLVPQKKKEDVSSSVSIQTEQEVPEASSKLNNLHL